MSAEQGGWVSISWALKVLPVVGSLCAFLVWQRTRRSMSKKKDGSSVENYGSKQVLERIEVNVELISGVCYVENGDAKLKAKCNAVLAEMNQFQRRFLMTAPEGQPNKMMFTELILQDVNNGSLERKAFFQPPKPETEGGFIGQFLGWATSIF